MTDSNGTDPPTAWTYFAIDAQNRWAHAFAGVGSPALHEHSQTGGLVGAAAGTVDLFDTQGRQLTPSLAVADPTPNPTFEQRLKLVRETVTAAAPASQRPQVEATVASLGDNPSAAVFMGAPGFLQTPGGWLHRLICHGGR